MLPGSPKEGIKKFRAEILTKCRCYFGRNDDLINSFRLLLTFMPILQDAVFSTKYSGPNATSNDKHLSRGGTLSSPSNRVNSYDPDDGQLSLLKTPVGLSSSLGSA